MSRLLSLFLLVVAVIGGGPSVHAQSNDNFANRLTLTGPAPIAVSNNLRATPEGGEPNHAGASTGRSLWYSWTAPTTGIVNIGTYSTSTGTPTVRALAVYTGNSYSTLSEVASSNNQVQSLYAAGAYLSTALLGGTSINLPATAGTVYQIAVDAVVAPSTVDDDGTVVLAINAPPTILSAASAIGTVGADFSYTIAATGGSTVYSASNLPIGLSLNPATGQITGVVGTAGIYVIALSATGPGGTGDATLTLRVDDPASAGPTPPVVYSAASVRGFVNQSFNYSILATGSPTLYSVTTLPAGLSCNAQTGVISGTPTIAGTFSVPVTVSGSGTAGAATLTFFIVASPVPPVVISPLAASGSLGSPFVYTVVTSADANSGLQSSQINATNLPDGLKISSTSSLPAAQSTQITGTPTKAGVSAVPITINSNGGTRQATVTITIVDPATVVATGRPALTSAATVTGSLKTAFSYQLAATNAPTNFSATNLPPGITFDSSSHTLSGTPTTAGTFLVPVSAANSYGTSTGTLTVTIASSDLALQAANGYALPVITSAASAVMYTGQTASYVIAANYQGIGAVTSGAWTFSATGLPPGLSVAGSSSSYGTGYISGTPTATGTYQATVSATYPASATLFGSATLHPAVTTTAVVTFTVNAGPAPLLPIIRSAATARLTVGTAGSYQGSVSNGPASYAASNLPPGLSMNSSGAVAGTPTTGGTYPATISASNAAGTFNATVTFFVVPGPLPEIVSSATAQATVGTASSYNISAQNGGSPYSADNLPPGLSLNTTTGVISGTPTTAGVYTVPISASNASGATRATVVYTVFGPVASPPGVGGTLVYRITVNTYGVYAVHDYATDITYTASGLPPGMTFNASTGIISGTPTTVGTYTVPVSTTNVNGTSSATLTFVVGNPPIPQLINSAAASLTTGVSFSSSFYVLNSPTSVTITGLPPGLSFNFSPSDYTAGTISGTPTTAGTYRAAVTASNAGGSISGTFTMVVNPTANAPAFQPGTSEERILPVGTSFSENFATSPAAASYAASGLPAGLSLNTTTGLVSGTPTTAGTNTVTVTATNASGSVSLRTVYLVVPAITTLPSFDGPSTQSGYAGLPFPSVTTAASQNVAATYSATGLPPGLSMDPGTGVITGTATTVGQYSARLTVTNPAGTGTAVLTILIKDPSAVSPQFNYTSAEDDVLVGTTPSLGIYASATDHGTAVATSLTFTITGLPPGMTATPGANGVAVQGAPTAAGDYNITATATVPGGGSASESILLRVLNPVGPTITGEAGESGNVDLAFSAQIYASPSITAYSAINLPPGLMLNATTGAITGTPTSAGTFAANVTVTGATGTCSGIVTFRIDPRIYGGMPFINSAASVGSQEFPSDGSVAFALYTQPTMAVRYAITAYNKPGSYAASGLPAGLTLNPSTGIISGIPSVTGIFQVPISAANSVGTGRAVLTIISTTPLAQSQVALVSNCSLGTACRLTAAAIFPSNTPTSPYYNPPSTYLPYVPPVVSYVATGLPPGLTINTADGTISGVPTKTGSYPVTLSVTDRAGSGSAIVTFAVSDAAPPVTTPVLVNSATAVGFTGLPIKYPLSAPGATSFTANSLPVGVVFNSATGVFTGTPTTAGLFAVAVSASNTVGTTAATLTFDIETAPIAPVLTSPAGMTATIGRPFSGAVTVSNSSLASAVTNYAATNLPTGLSLNASTGLLGGTPTGPAGTYTVPIAVTAGQSPASCGSLTLIVQDASAAGPPLLTSTAGALGLVGNRFVYVVIDPAFVPAAESLPAGLTYDPVQGVISGYPMAAGNSLVSLEAPAAARGTGVHGAIGLARPAKARSAGSGSNPSAILTVRVLAPDRSLPRITTPPVGGTAGQSAGFTFSVAATGAPVPAYQWYHDGVAIAGATGATLTLSPLKLTDSGNYTVAAANTAGSVTSQPVTLLVSTSYAQWQTNYFTAQEIAAGLANDHTSFSGDSVPNLLKYALDLDPRTVLDHPLPFASSRSAVDGRLQIAFNRDAALTDINYVVEASTDLSTWAAIAQSVAGAPFTGLTGLEYVAETPITGSSQRAVMVKAALSSASSQFLRLRITRP